eukprot:2400969-Pyramimonas_sp.AAC.1
MPSVHVALTVFMSTSSERRSVLLSTSRPSILLLASTLSRPSSVTERVTPLAATPGTACTSARPRSCAAWARTPGGVDGSSAE